MRTGAGTTPSRGRSVHSGSSKAGHDPLAILTPTSGTADLHVVRVHVTKKYLKSVVTTFAAVLVNGHQANLRFHYVEQSGKPVKFPGTPSCVGFAAVVPDRSRIVLAPTKLPN